MATPPVFWIKVGNTGPPLEATLLDDQKLAVDLTGATITFNMATTAGVNLVNTSATIVSATAGTVQYSWVTADTATAGVHEAEFIVTLADTSIVSFPNFEHITVHVVAVVPAS